MRIAIKLMAAASMFCATAAFAAGGHPCKEIESACAAAGFVKGGAKVGKGLGKNCMEPLLAGQAVPGVNVDPAMVQACVAKRAEHKEKKGAPPEGMPPAGAPNGGEPPPSK